MRFRKLLIFSTVVLSPALVTAQSDRGYTICSSPNLSVSAPQGFPDNGFLAVRFGSYRLRESTGALTFRNMFQQKIRGIEASVEYQNESDDSTVVIPFVATTSEARGKFHRKVYTDLINKLNRALAAGHTKRLNGENFAIVRNCPTKAKIGYVHVLFANGHSAEWEVKGWTTGPVIKEVPLTVEFSCHSDLNSSLNLEARTNTEGRISDLQLLRPVRWPCIENLKRSVENWVFYPATRDGNPSDGKFKMALRFLPEPPGEMHGYDVEPTELSGPTVPIDFVHTRSKVNEWVVVYGPQPFGFLKK